MRVCAARVARAHVASPRAVALDKWTPDEYEDVAQNGLLIFVVEENIISTIVGALSARARATFCAA